MILIAPALSQPDIFSDQPWSYVLVNAVDGLPTQIEMRESVLYVAYQAGNDQLSNPELKVIKGDSIISFQGIEKFILDVDTLIGFGGYSFYDINEAFCVPKIVDLIYPQESQINCTPENQFQYFSDVLFQLNKSMVVSSVYYKDTFYILTQNFINQETYENDTTGHVPFSVEI